MASCRCVYMIIAARVSCVTCRAGKAVKRGTAQHRSSHFLSVCLKDGGKQ